MVFLWESLYDGDDDHELIKSKYHMFHDRKSMGRKRDNVLFADHDKDNLIDDEKEAEWVDSDDDTVHVDHSVDEISSTRHTRPYFPPIIQNYLNEAKTIKSTKKRKLAVSL
jgi:hypothetical protein